MDIQAEKLELMRLIAEVKSEKVLTKIKNLLQPKRATTLPQNPQNDKNTNIAVSELAAMADASFADVWDNAEDERWDIYLKDKLTHV